MIFRVFVKRSRKGIEYSGPSTFDQVRREQQQRQTVVSEPPAAGSDDEGGKQQRLNDGCRVEFFSFFWKG